MGSTKVLQHDEGHFYCPVCNKEWSAMMGDDEVPEYCIHDPKTSDEYASGGGCVCPWCDSNDISGGGLTDIDGGSASQVINCDKCGKVWTEFYLLTGYEEWTE